MPNDIFSLLDRNPDTRVVCFDFFDTLVHRTVEPEHTKRVAARQLALLMQSGMTGDELYRRRFELEARLCRENVEKGLDLDFRITDLAPVFYDSLQHDFSEMPAFLTREMFGKVFLEIEVLVEISVQRIFEDMHGVLQEVRRRGIAAAVVSDFYVPSEIFRRFVRHHGWDDAVDRIFVSCDYGVTKGSGKLYGKVIDRLNCRPEEVLMIGDNEHSDIHMAASAGLKTHGVDRSDQRAFYRRWLQEQEDGPRRQKGLRERMDAAVREKAGSIFPEMALTLWRFVHLLFRRLVRDEVRDVFFFSKEGEFLRVLFDRYQEEQFGCRIVRSHYLLVSRKATFVCSLKPLMEENFSRLFYQYRDISPRDFLLSLNFPESAARDHCDRLGIAFDERIRYFGISDAFVSLVGDPGFAEAYETQRSTQRANLLSYLRSFHVDIHGEAMNIVDVGWKGSIQDNLFFALDQQVRMKGYYLGLLQPTNSSEKNRKTGILFSDSPVETPFLEVYNSNRSLFEMLLTATHGSADGYFSGEEVCTENGDSQTAEGTGFQRHGPVRVRTLDLPEERTLFEERIRPIQERFVAAHTELNRLTRVSTAPAPGSEWFARHHARMMYEPSAEEISLFESLYHLENFGFFEFTDFRAEKSLGAEEKAQNLRAFREDPEAIYRSGIWAPVALKRLGLENRIAEYHQWCLKRIFGETRALFRRFNRNSLLRFLHRFRPNRTVSIVFFLGSPDINGGTYVIFEHAVRLQAKGYRVYVITEEPVEPQRHAWHPDAGRLEWITFDQTGGRKFDYAVATWWRSAFLLRQVEADAYLYFVQSIETRFFPAEDRCTYVETIGKRLAEQTYTIPLPVITEARWIQRFFSEHFGRAAHLVRNGIRKDIYTVDGSAHAPRDPGALRVLVEGPLGVRYKNVERTVEICRRSDADEIWLLTSSETEALPGVDRLFSRIPIWETPAVYRSCDVLVKLSYVEGMFGPPLEMFHCGGTAVVYDVTGHDDYIRHDENALVIPTDDEDAVVAALNRLKREPETLNRLKAGALKSAAQWPDWDAVSRDFERALRDSYKRYPTSRAHLHRATERIWRSAHENADKAHLFADYRGERPAPQFCQIFWHFGGGFSEEASEKLEYESGRWVTVRKTLSVPAGASVHLRIDPSQQVGVGYLKEIVVRNPRHEVTLFAADPKNRWDGLEISGTACRIQEEDDSHLAVKAYEEDPQFLLPVLHAEDGQRDIDIGLSLRFLPFPLQVAVLLQTAGNAIPSFFRSGSCAAKATQDR